MGLSKSWACRLHARAIQLVRGRWRMSDEGGDARDGARRALLLVCARARRGGVLDQLAARPGRTAANETVAALDGPASAPRSSPTRRAPTPFTVRSPRHDAGGALELLRSLGLPRDRRHGFAEVYGQPSLIPTASEERARYLEALSGEIERTLEIADGVVSARVHLVLEEIDPLAADAKPRTPARAAVLLKARAGRSPLRRGGHAKAGRGQRARARPGGGRRGGHARAATAESRRARWPLGPLRVRGSRPLLIAALASASPLLAVLAALLLLIRRRRLALLQQGRQ